MEREFWLERWEAGRLGFHASEVNPNLTAHHQQLTRGESSRVLVPLCGKSVDLAWLASQGHSVCGVELIALAAEQFFDEKKIAAERAQTASGHLCFRGGGIEIIVADFLELTAGDVGTVGCAWDRAALVALPPQVRARYTALLRQLCPGPILLNSFTYDQAVMDGPPFSVDEPEIRGHYPSEQVEILSHNDVIDRVPFKERGHTFWFSTVYLITAS